MYMHQRIMGLNASLNVKFERKFLTKNYKGHRNLHGKIIQNFQIQRTYSRLIK